MGVDDYLLTSTVLALVGQRLVRLLCRQCRVPYGAPDDLIVRLGLDRLTAERPIRLWEASGCAACDGTGYRGRSSILEVLVLSDPIRQLVLRHAEAREIAAQAVAEGMRTMQIHGLLKALEGETSLAEVLRATRDG